MEEFEILGNEPLDFLGIKIPGINIRDHGIMVIAKLFVDPLEINWEKQREYICRISDSYIVVPGHLLSPYTDVHIAPGASYTLIGVQDLVDVIMSIDIRRIPKPKRHLIHPYKNAIKSLVVSKVDVS